LINGCARFLGRIDGLKFKKAIDYFGPPIATAWREWSQSQPPETIGAGLKRLGKLAPEEARREATAALTRSATCSSADLETAIDYLSAIPAAVARCQETTGHDLPWPLDREASLAYLPIHTPPYSLNETLADSNYRLEEILGSGELGVVYRLGNLSDPRQARVVKFCLDNTLVGALAHEREHLNRLLTLGLARWSSGLCRLYSYNLDVQVPYLVYEYCRGVDLGSQIRRVRGETGTGISSDNALELIRQIAAALAFVHGRGMVYGDLKPADVIVHEGMAKLTDFGTTAVSAAQAAQTCPISSREGSPLISAATHARLQHGSNTSMYMSSEQRRGDQPEPHHDLYSLGVLWFQILVGDITREMHPGWAEELVEERQTPKSHVEAIQRCVGYYKKRPASAADFLGLLQSLTQPGMPRPSLVSLVSERLRQLDERFARTGRGSVGPSSEQPSKAAGSDQDTVFGQPTRMERVGIVPKPGISPAQINRDAELSRLKQLLSDQLARNAYQEAHETLQVLSQLYPQDPQVEQARALLGRQA
jgi:serine/threonine protein kinase